MGRWARRHDTDAKCGISPNALVHLDETTSSKGSTRRYARGGRSSIARLILSSPHITKIGVGGFKSISRPQSIEVRPLTILAGTNSSGKSSIMQPLLLMKQTLEASYDPGPLLLNGPNVRFTLAKQLFSLTATAEQRDQFTVEIATDKETARSSIVSNAMMRPALLSQRLPMPLAKRATTR